MRIVAARRSASRSNSCSAKRSPRRRESTSARTAPSGLFASPIRARWTSSRRLLRGLRALSARSLPEEIEPRLFGEHLGRIPSGGLVESPTVHLQSSLDVLEAPRVFAEDLRADRNVDFRLEERGLAAMVDELLKVEFRDDLHEALGAHRAFGHRVVARFDGHYRKNEHRVYGMLLARAVSDLYEVSDRFIRHSVALGDEFRDRPLLALTRSFGRAWPRGAGRGGS